MTSPNYRCGAVALVGKPNVGKSTLTNLLVGQKVTIVSNKPQTTRRAVRGIVTTQGYQIVLVDTPGIHSAHTELGKRMNDAARSSLGDVDLILVMVDGSKSPNDEDKALAKVIKNAWRYPYAEENPGQTGVILCLNKMDILKAEYVQENLDAYLELFNPDAWMMTSLTKKRANVDKLVSLVVERLPEQEAIFPEEMVTDEPVRRMSSELIREKALQLTREEVPHAIGCVIDVWEEPDQEVPRTQVFASLICEKEGQKAILIGKRGSMLKEIGSAARHEIQELIGGPVYLEIHVKVRPDWRQNRRMLHDMEYDNA